MENQLQKIIKGRERDDFRFRPARSFFTRIGIGQKRFGQILRNEKQPDEFELQRLAENFEVTVNELISNGNED